MGGCGWNIDIVDADAGAADHFEAARLIEKFCGDLGRGADRKPVETRDCRGQLVFIFAEIGLKIDLDAAILEDLNSGGRQRIGDEDAGGHDGILCGQRNQRNMWG